MTLRDLLEYCQKYAETYPGFLDNDVIFTTPRKRRSKGNFYHRYKATSIGLNSCVSQTSLDVGIEPIF